MGVTDADWKMLAMDALMAMDLQVATKAYIKVRDMKSIDLINRIKASRRLPGHYDQVFLSTVSFASTIGLFCLYNMSLLSLQ